MSDRDDDQKELWDAYYTHPERMDGEGASGQANAMQEQISAFEKLLQHAMSRFSRDKCYSMLKTLSQRECSRHPTSRGKIDSVFQLRRIRKELGYETSRRGAQRDQDTSKYLEGLLEDLQYMKDLKKYFDEKIYSALYQYFYDSKFENSDDEDEGPRARRNKRQDTNDDINFSELTDKQKLGQAIAQMQDINTKWDSLLSEDELDEYMFDSDSYHEIVQFKDFKPFELMFRLIPDIFVKAYKSIEVSKTWWTQADKVFPKESRSANVEVDFNYKVNAMERLVAKLEDDIKEEEEILAHDQESLEFLRGREGRWNTLSENCSKVEQAKQNADMKYNHMKVKRQSLVQELKEPRTRDSDRYNQVNEKLEKLDEDMWQAYDQLQLLTFQLKILHQDLDVEMTVRPEMIRYLGSLEEKVAAVERSLSQKKNSKEESEKQLQAIRRNLRAMKDIMISRSNTEMQPFERGYSSISNDHKSGDSDEKEKYGNYNLRDSDLRYEDRDRRDSDRYEDHNSTDDLNSRDANQSYNTNNRNDESRDENKSYRYDSRLDRKDSEDRYEDHNRRETEQRYEDHNSRDSDQKYGTNDRSTESRDGDKPYPYSRSERKSSDYSTENKWKPKAAYVRRKSKKDREY